MKPGDEMTFFDDGAYLGTYCQYGILLFLLFCLLLLVVLAYVFLANKKSTAGLQSLANRIAVGSFLLGCIFATFEIWHGFGELAEGTGSELANVVLHIMSVASSKLFYGCSLSLLSVVLSTILKSMDNGVEAKSLSKERNPSDSNQPKDLTAG